MANPPQSLNRRLHKVKLMTSRNKHTLATCDLVHMKHVQVGTCKSECSPMHLMWDVDVLNAWEDMLDVRRSITHLQHALTPHLWQGLFRIHSVIGMKRKSSQEIT